MITSIKLCSNFLQPALTPKTEEAKHRIVIEQTVNLSFFSERSAIMDSHSRMTRRLCCQHLKLLV